MDQRIKRGRSGGWLVHRMMLFRGRTLVADHVMWPAVRSFMMRTPERTLGIWVRSEVSVDVNSRSESNMSDVH